MQFSLFLTMILMSLGENYSILKIFAMKIQENQK